MAFAQKRSTCIGCKAVLKTDGVFSARSVQRESLCRECVQGPHVWCVAAAAVCDFCKKKESELYQKEVTFHRPSPTCSLNSTTVSVKQAVNVFLSWSDLPPEHARGAFLSAVDSVSAVSGFPPWGRAVHQVRHLLSHTHWGAHGVTSTNGPVSLSAAGTVLSSTWGWRFRKIWTTKASWSLDLDGERSSSLLSGWTVILYYLCTTD